jgi:hypothetical protein
MQIPYKHSVKIMVPDRNPPDAGDDSAKFALIPEKAPEIPRIFVSRLRYKRNNWENICNKRENTGKPPLDKTVSTKVSPGAPYRGDLLPS